MERPWSDFNVSQIQFITDHSVLSWVVDGDEKVFQLEKEEGIFIPETERQAMRRV